MTSALLLVIAEFSCSIIVPLHCTGTAEMAGLLAAVLSCAWLVEGEARITKTMDQWVCDYCSMGKYSNIAIQCFTFLVRNHCLTLFG